MAVHAFPFIYKKMAADGSTLDSAGVSFLTLASTYDAQYVFQAGRGVYLFGRTSPGLFRGYTADRVTVTGAPAAAWSKTFGQDMPDEEETAGAIATTADGGFVLAGTRQDSSGNDDVWVFRADALGGVLWEKIYAEVAYGGLFSMTLTTDGYLAATGGAWEPSGITSRALALKANAGDGSLIWQKQFSRGDTGYWLGTAALPAPSSGMCFMGTLLQPPANADLFSAIFRYRVSISSLDADGNLVSEQTFGNDATRPIGESAAGTSDGHVIFCATIEFGTSLQDAWVVKTAFETVSAAEPEQSLDFSIYPNPASGYTRLSLNSTYAGPVQIRVFDTAGREVARMRGEKDAGDWNMDLPLGGLQTGTYRMQLVAGGGQGIKTIAVVGN